MTKLKGTFILL